MAKPKTRSAVATDGIGYVITGDVNSPPEIVYPQAHQGQQITFNVREGRPLLDIPDDELRVIGRFLIDLDRSAAIKPESAEENLFEEYQVEAALRFSTQLDR